MEYIDQAEMTLDVMKELNQHGLELVNRQAFYTVVDLRNMYGSITNEAKEFAAKDKELNDLRICESLLVNSLPIKLLVDGYLKFNRPISPTKVFSKITSCAMWMQTKGCAIDDIITMKRHLQENKL